MQQTTLLELNAVEELAHNWIFNEVVMMLLRMHTLKFSNCQCNGYVVN